MGQQADRVQGPPQPEDLKGGFFESKEWPWTVGAVLGLAMPTMGKAFGGGFEFGQLFIAPMFLGMMGGFAVGFVRKQTVKGLWSSLIPFFLVNIVLYLALNLDGMICLFMGAPLVGGEYVMGFAMTFFLAQAIVKSTFPVLSLAMVALTAWWYGGPGPAKNNVVETTTSVVVDAPVERVWDVLKKGGPVPESDYFLYKLGVAHPMRTEYYGYRVGDLRICRLSTGPMPERITEWSPGEAIGFRVIDTPAPMKELNPFYPDTGPSHLYDTYSVLRGRITLTALPGGRTELTGTTWSVNRMEPLWYWRLWTEEIVHQVHREVFAEVKKESEGLSR